MASVWRIRWICVIGSLTKFPFLFRWGRLLVGLLLWSSQSCHGSLLIVEILSHIITLGRVEVVCHVITLSRVCCRYINRLVWTLVGKACFLIFVLRWLVLNYPARILVLLQFFTRWLFGFEAIFIWFLIVLVLGIVVGGLWITFVSSVLATKVASWLASISVLIPQILIHFLQDLNIKDFKKEGFWGFGVFGFCSALFFSVT